MTLCIIRSVRVTTTYCLRICRNFTEQVRVENVNTIVSTQRNLKLTESEVNTVATRGKFVVKPMVIKVCDGDHTVKRELDAAKDSMKILGIIEKHHIDIKNASIYGKAIQKCNVLRDWSSAQKIMNLLLKNPNTKPSLTEFHVFMNAMTRCSYHDALHIIMRTFDSMIHKHKLTPDIITFGILLKAFTKELKYEEIERRKVF